jgi:CheY-like chemotaxis protein
MPTVAIVGGSREVRLLIKGLLRLHHHAVVAEGASFDVLNGLAADAFPEVIVVDFDPTEPSRIEAVRVARKAHPACRFVLLTPGSGPGAREAARSAGANAIVGRPFAVRELIEAVSPGAGSPPPSGAPPPQG